MTSFSRRHPLVAFFALAYGISWILWAPLWLPAFGVRGLPVLPFHHALGALGPIAAAFLVSGLETGWAGLADLLRRMALWRGRPGWVVVGLLAPFALLGLASAGASVIDGQSLSLVGFGRSREFPQFSAVGFLAYNIVSFGYGEETGWRGFALPRLQTRHSALVASLLLTVGWALWHTPLFFYRPGYTSMDAAGVAGWFFSLLTGAVLLTWLYNGSRGSILVVALFHASVDVAFTSSTSSPSVVTAAGALITFWGIIVVVAAGPRYLARRGKMVRPDHGDTVTGFVERVGLVVILLCCLAGETRAQAEHPASHSVGPVRFPVTCSDSAQAEFNRAVALLHHMTYPRARDAFQHVATTDSQCAMAHWGVAMTMFQPLWPTRPRAQELQRGWEAVERAVALQPPTERERLFVATAEAFFLEPASPDYWLRIRRWEAAAARVYAAFPDDDEAAAFYALALLATAPSDTMSRTHADRAAEILLRVYDRNPDHPGAMHYLVHANDGPARARERLEIIRKYEASAPKNPHALHMPTHIYTRLGDWDGVIRGNLSSADVALKYPAGDHGEFVWDQFPHAIEYLVYAYLQKGSDDAAAGQLNRLRGTARLEPTFISAFHLASTQARYTLERRAWNEARSIVPREPATLDWDRFAWPEAIARFARGLGAAHVGDVAEATAAGERLGELEALTRKGGEDLFARNIRLLRLELTAWVAHVEGQADSSVALMKEAVELEASTPKHAVTPGPTLPAQELLGDLFMDQKRPADALAAYRRSIELYPRRFNGLLGAARAARALGDTIVARAYYHALLDLARGGTRQAGLKEATTYATPTRTRSAPAGARPFPRTSPRPPSDGRATPP